MTGAPRPPMIISWRRSSLAMHQLRLKPVMIGGDQTMDDAQVLAAATSRYEAFRVLLPRVLDDIKASIEVRDVKLGFEIRASLASAAADATARLVVGSRPESES